MVRVDPLSPGQEQAFLTLYRDCLAHYGTTPASPEVEAEVIADLLAPRGMFADIAWDGKLPLGFTTWVKVYPAMDGFALYLKELYVVADARGTGTGSALMRRMADHALTLGAVRLDWGSFQPEALKFYAALGANTEEKAHFTVSKGDLQGFAR